jgi:CheY-like chemotaxis protein
MPSVPLSVLLIDDDRDARNVFQMIIEHYHLQFAVVENAEDAYQYLSKSTPDVIVIDIFLPGTDGYQTLHHIRKHGLAPASAVVATTAYYTSDTQREVLAWGFNGYLPKPFNAETLVPFLQQVADGVSSLDA